MLSRRWCLVEICWRPEDLMEGHKCRDECNCCRAISDRRSWTSRNKVEGVEPDAIAALVLG